ncbi:hypothetical protein B296_00019755 [Ensete ventricosum]|uniref:Uncharacterized protein n=1 Tax=Ensete ventricosum TaxID=4639 RepID=A0A426ZNC2_ENSVE|nr:hypothetical protein B296_00019755 [Ensete ventricosum]
MKLRIIELARALQQDGEGHSWWLQSVFPSTKENCSENTGVLKQVVERGEEVTMSPERLSYPRAKHRSERRRVEAKELYKTSVNVLLIKIAKSGGLRIDIGVLD